MPLPFNFDWTVMMTHLSIRPCAFPVPSRVIPVRVAVAAVALIAGATLSASPVNADRLAGAALAQKGSKGVPACMACHGPNGEGQTASGFPRLAGQPEAYLLKQLQAFATGQRKNPQMMPIAGALDAQQMRDAAGYYASLPGWQPQGNTHAPTPQYELGRRLATAGNWSKEVPACFACHGPGGAGVPPHFPALAGQPSAYTRSQMKAWQTATRTNDPQGLMQSVAEKMTDAEFDAVSLYLENPSLDGKGN